MGLFSWLKDIFVEKTIQERMAKMDKDWIMRGGQIGHSTMTEWHRKEEEQRKIINGGDDALINYFKNGGTWQCK